MKTTVTLEVDTQNVEHVWERLETIYRQSHEGEVREGELLLLTGVFYGLISQIVTEFKEAKVWPPDLRAMSDDELERRLK